MNHQIVIARPTRYGHTADFANPQATLRGPNGRLLCRVCGVEVGGRRRTFCSDVCVETWSIRNSPGFARKVVRKRDRSICSMCGLDCLWFVKRLRVIWKERDDRFRRAVLRILGLKRVPSTCWHMDHVIPVAEGGGCCGLENLRTLCIFCHRGETRKLMRRLRFRRKIRYRLRDAVH